MSILELDLEGATEPTIVDADEEYKLRIVSCGEIRQDKKGNDYILPRFEIPDSPASKEFTKYLKLATKKNLEGLSAKQINSLKWGNTQFFECFKVDPSRLEPGVDLPGKTGWAILGIENDEEYGDKNYVKKFIVGQ